MKNLKLILLTILAITVLASCKKSNTEPVAVFTIDPASGQASTNFTFDASGSYDEEDQISDLQFRWDWENDSDWDTDFSGQPTANHIFSEEGSYTIKLEVKDKEGLSGFITRTLNVSLTNEPPEEPFGPKPTDLSSSNLTWLQLKWHCTDMDGDSLTFDIYLGTHSDPPLVESDWDTTAYQTGTLVIDTTYYWKIIAKDGFNNSTDGPEWTFKTGVLQYDSRDGNTYRTVRIGQQYWMAENLNYKTETGSRYYEDSTEYSSYGLLYLWDAAISACPNGWHLASDEDWLILESYLGMSERQVNRLGLRGINEGNQIKSTTEWYQDSLINGNGSDSWGFTAYPAGTYWTDGYFDAFGFTARFWTSTEKAGVYSYYRVLNYHVGGILRTYNVKTDGFSVRCIRD